MSLLFGMISALAAAVPTAPPPARAAQPVYATVTIIAAELIDTKAPPTRGSAQASSRQHRERDKLPLVEFF